MQPNKEPEWEQVGKANKKVEVRQSGDLEDSPIQRMFGGQTRSTVRAKAKGDSVSLEAFTLLALDIVSEDVTDISNAIGKICAEEKVSDRGMTKRVQFKQLPKVLVLQLNRFAFNPQTSTACKVKKSIDFQLTFNFDLEWCVDDIKGPIEYTLYSIICHIGENADGGHYNAIVRYNVTDPNKDPTGQAGWFLFDDMSVRPIYEAEVLKHGATAYLLIYMLQNEKVDIFSASVHEAMRHEAEREAAC